MKYTDWWWDTAQHMWRLYFALERDPPLHPSPANQHVRNLCETILHDRFTADDIPIMRDYYAYRDTLDRKFVTDYSTRTGTPEFVVWRIVRNANRAVIEALGIIDQKKGVFKP